MATTKETHNPSLEQEGHTIMYNLNGTSNIIRSVSIYIYISHSIIKYKIHKFVGDKCSGNGREKIMCCVSFYELYGQFVC